ncbi:hypothetical protein RchiOBHm_Chr2g0131531 [Rosa chinensis]|uniref:Uncharacterized protein n=1 Tax=Rosa chinensis TaxID=74649 RepID=A0A2P6RV32_ROSCH|nr:hypothetical protein RchiOBHm_Chr2g0131531 [Rosa chinensis]
MQLLQAQRSHASSDAGTQLPLSSGDVFILLALFLQNLERTASKLLCGGTREVRSGLLSSDNSSPQTR